ncbi:MAG TPA: hypothetical protein ENH82_15005 [bacterium]|nr:hypothetical protein [bacterium]
MQRTLKALRDKGYKSAKVEHFNPHAGMFGCRQDLFRIIDVLALTPEGVLGIQVCGSDFSGHLRKITETEKENAFAWLNTPGTILEIHAWRKLKVKRGGKAMKWDCKIQRITINDINPVVSKKENSEEE